MIRIEDIKGQKRHTTEETGRGPTAAEDLEAAEDLVAAEDLQAAEDLTAVGGQIAEDDLIALSVSMQAWKKEGTKELGYSLFSSATCYES